VFSEKKQLFAAARIYASHLTDEDVQRYRIASSSEAVRSLRDKVAKSQRIVVDKTQAATENIKYIRTIGEAMKNNLFLDGDKSTGNGVLGIFLESYGFELARSKGSDCYFKSFRIENNKRTPDTEVTFVDFGCDGVLDTVVTEHDHSDPGELEYEQYRDFLKFLSKLLPITQLYK
jgi:hypothetical protein